MNLHGLTFWGALGWLIVNVVAVLYHIKKVNLMKAQSIESLGNLLKNKQDAIRRWNESLSKAKAPIRELIRLKQTGASKDLRREARNDFADLLTNTVVDDFIAMVEWVHLEAQTYERQLKGEQLDRVITEVVFPELERFQSWRKVLNADEFCRDIGGKPLTFSERSFRDLYRCLNGLPNEKHGIRARKLRQLIQELCVE